MGGDQRSENPIVMSKPLRIFVSLAIAMAGGSVFHWLGVPLPWMLGPMFFCLAASLLSFPVTAPTRVRPLMLGIIGAMIGASFGSDVLGQIPGWWITILGLVGYLLAAGTICVSYFYFIARFDLRTAYFSGMPGGMVEMVFLGEDSGADMRKVALVHSSRILLTVFSVPFVVQLLSNETINRGARASVSMMDVSVSGYFWLLVSVVCGFLLPRIVRLPAPFLMGPMLFSAIIHLAGWSAFKVPWELVTIAQLVLGTTIGSRFAGIGCREVLPILAVASGSALLLLSTGFGFAYVLSGLSGHGVSELLLAYSPAGLAEMGLVAVALNLEVALVAAHHILRISLVAFGASLFMPVFGIPRRKKA